MKRRVGHGRRPWSGTSMTWVDPSNSSNVRTVTTSTAYNALDRVSSSVDQFGKTSQTHYDSMGRVTSTIDTLNNTTSSIYDARDELIQTIYPVDPNYPAGTTSESFFDAEGLRDSPPESLEQLGLALHSDENWP